MSVTTDSKDTKTKSTDYNEPWRAQMLPMTDKRIVAFISKARSSYEALKLNTLNDFSAEDQKSLPPSIFDEYETPLAEQESYYNSRVVDTPVSAQQCVVFSGTNIIATVGVFFDQYDDLYKGQQFVALQSFIALPEILVSRYLKRLNKHQDVFINDLVLEVIEQYAVLNHCKFIIANPLARQEAVLRKHYGFATGTNLSYGIDNVNVVASVEFSIIADDIMFGHALVQLEVINDKKLAGGKLASESLPNNDNKLSSRSLDKLPISDVKLAVNNLCGIQFDVAQITEYDLYLLTLSNSKINLDVRGNLNEPGIWRGICRVIISRFITVLTLSGEITMQNFTNLLHNIATRYKNVNMTFKFADLTVR